MKSLSVWPVLAGRPDRVGHLVRLPGDRLARRASPRAVLPGDERVSGEELGRLYDADLPRDRPDGVVERSHRRLRLEDVHDTEPVRRLSGDVRDQPAERQVRGGLEPGLSREPADHLLVTLASQARCLMYSHDDHRDLPSEDWRGIR